MTKQDIKAAYQCLLSMEACRKLMVDVDARNLIEQAMQDLQDMVDAAEMDSENDDNQFGVGA